MNTAEIATTQTVYLSKRGRKEIKKNLGKLEHERRQLIKGLHELDRTYSHEGRYEKTERLSRLDAVEMTISEQRMVLQSAQELPRQKSRLEVAIGSVVELVDRYGQHFIYRLVDTIEADPSKGRISVSSPLGQRLVGKRAFDTITWSGANTRQLQLVRIS